MMNLLHLYTLNEFRSDESATFVYVERVPVMMNLLHLYTLNEFP